MSSHKCKALTSAVSLTVENFGIIEDEEKNVEQLKVFKWTNTIGTEVKVTNYGGYITSIIFPDKEGDLKDIVVGFHNWEGYLRPDNSYFGCTVGRCANRIAEGKLKIDGEEYTLATNDGPNHLHGGMKGFDKVIWAYSIQGNRVTLSYISPDMEEGYPGTLLVNVSFELTFNNVLVIHYKAMTTKPTVVNLTNHSYFNLAGNDAGAKELYNHIVQINADNMTPVNDNLIPTGEIKKVDKTVFDFQNPVRLGDVINKVPNSPGFDHNFIIVPEKSKNKHENFVASVIHPESGRKLDVFSDLPAVQFYTGNFLPEDNSIEGKSGGYIKKHGAFCLETQNYPDAINHANFPSPVLYPGDVYETTTKFKFGTEGL